MWFATRQDACWEMVSLWGTATLSGIVVVMLLHSMRSHSCIVVSADRPVLVVMMMITIRRLEEKSSLNTNTERY